jgi:DNA-binding GntR family transcriptional regulator
VVYQATPGRLSDQVYEELKRRIIEGTYPPRAHLTERELAAQLQAGRTPMREALQRLVRGHFLTVVPGGGYFVTDISGDAELHIYELRQAVEALSARLAAERATVPDIHALEAFVVQAALDPPPDADGYWHLGVDERFHLLIARASQNQYVESTVGDLYTLTQRILVARRPQIPLVADELEFYRKLTAAIVARDVERSGRLMEDHLTSSVQFEDGVSLA